MGSHKAEILTALQLKFVAAYQGDGTAAAREAGAKNPSQYACSTLKVPAVVKALKAKQDKVVSDSAKLLAKKLAKADIAQGIIDDIEFLKQLRDRISNKKKIRSDEANTLVRATEAKIRASMDLAELLGFVFNKNININKMFDNLTEEELQSIVDHGYLPNSGPGQPASAGPQSPGCNPAKPN